MKNAKAYQSGGTMALQLGPVLIGQVSNAIGEKKIKNKALISIFAIQ
jgi:hypothetical protein